MAFTQAERIARVDARKRLPKAPPWQMELKGTIHMLAADSVSVAALAEGRVTARLQVQAARLVHCLDLLKEPV